MKQSAHRWIGNAGYITGIGTRRPTAVAQPWRLPSIRICQSWLHAYNICMAARSHRAQLQSGRESVIDLQPTCRCGVGVPGNPHQVRWKCAKPGYRLKVKKSGDPRSRAGGPASNLSVCKLVSFLSCTHPISSRQPRDGNRSQRPVHHQNVIICNMRARL